MPADLTPGADQVGAPPLPQTVHDTKCELTKTRTHWGPKEGCWCADRAAGFEYWGFEEYRRGRHPRDWDAGPPNHSQTGAA